MELKIFTPRLSVSQPGLTSHSFSLSLSNLPSQPLLVFLQWSKREMNLLFSLLRLLFSHSVGFDVLPLEERGPTLLRSPRYEEFLLISQLADDGLV